MGKQKVKRRLPRSEAVIIKVTIKVNEDFTYADALRKARENPENSYRKYLYRNFRK